MAWPIFRITAAGALALDVAALAGDVKALAHDPIHHEFADMITVSSATTLTTIDIQTFDIAEDRGQA